MNIDNLRSPSDLLRKLPLSKSTLYRLIKDGTIPAAKVGRRFLVDEKELMEVLENSKIAKNAKQ